jgi:hypothetical protein
MFDFPWVRWSYVHRVVQDINKTYGYDASRWREKRVCACFLDVSLKLLWHAARTNSDLDRRLCDEYVKTAKDFAQTGRRRRKVSRPPT